MGTGKVIGGGADVTYALRPDLNVVADAMLYRQRTDGRAQEGPWNQKRAMIRLPGALTSAKLKARMLLQVHDELLFEVPEKELDKTKTVTRTIMEGAAALTVPLVVETGVGDNWAAAH